MQAALAALNGKLREAAAQASVDAAAAVRAESLEKLLGQEEPRLRQLFEEKRQRYELDVGRLKELRKEITHLEHAEKKLEATVQKEFAQWQEAIKRRYEKASTREIGKEEAEARAFRIVERNRLIWRCKEL